MVGIFAIATDNSKDESYFVADVVQRCVCNICVLLIIPSISVLAIFKVFAGLHAGNIDIRRFRFVFGNQFVSSGRYSKFS